MFKTIGKSDSGEHAYSQIPEVKFELAGPETMRNIKVQSNKEKEKDQLP